MAELTLTPTQQALADRLRRGQAWLIRAYGMETGVLGVAAVVRAGQDWPAPPDDVQRFLDALDLWCELEAQWWQAHGQSCPVGGCDPLSPVWCQACGQDEEVF